MRTEHIPGLMLAVAFELAASSWVAFSLVACFFDLAFLFDGLETGQFLPGSLISSVGAIFDRNNLVLSLSDHYAGCRMLPILLPRSSMCGRGRAPTR